LNKDISSFKKIGYTEKIPKNKDLDSYEVISVLLTNNKKKTLYRKIKAKENEEISNFNKSWNIYNDLIDN
tara:strand:- start:333 stop:542 length:210 start_codon:yes stop_codon:yes gene_type:complete